MKIKLINLAFCSTSSFIFPPYGLAIINQYLNTKKFNAEIFDLDILIKTLNSRKNKQIVDIDYIKKIGNHCHNGCDMAYCSLKYKNKPVFNIKDHLLKLKEDEYFNEQLDKIISILDIKQGEILAFSASQFETFLILSLAKKIKQKKDIPIILGGKELRQKNKKHFEELIKKFKINYIDHFVIGDTFSFFDKLIENKIPTKSLKPIIHDDEDTCFLKKCNFPLFNKTHLELYKISPNKIKYFCNELSPNITEKIESLNNIKKPLVIPYGFQIGCYNNCAYCGFKKDVTLLKNEKIIKDIENLKKKYKTNNFYFLNTNLAIKKQYTNELMDQFKELGIKWADTVNSSSVNPKIIENFAKSGCIQLYMGFGTASTKLHNYTNRLPKKNFLTNYFNCFKATNDNGIWLITDFINGLPYEKKKDIIETKNFLLQNKKFINGILRGRFMMMKEAPFTQNQNKFKINFEQKNKKLYNLCTGYAFDETKGLKWNEKSKQICLSSNYFQKLIDNLFPNQIYSWYPIFLLYNNFNSKKEIIKYLNQK